MKTTDVIAAWLLFIWIFVTGSKPLFAFLDDLHTHRPISTTLWDVTVALFVAVCGWFLIAHFLRKQSELQRYEAEESRRLKELQSKRDESVGVESGHKT